jgi:hypothetical protein
MSDDDPDANPDGDPGPDDDKDFNGRYEIKTACLRCGFPAVLRVGKTDYFCQGCKSTRPLQKGGK